MGPKEKINHFNERFTTIINEFKPYTKPTQELQTQVYVNAFPAHVSMFIKQARNNTLAQNFEKNKKNLK
jgi:hypothetical protein